MSIDTVQERLSVAASWLTELRERETRGEKINPAAMTLAQHDLTIWTRRLEEAVRTDECP